MNIATLLRYMDQKKDTPWSHRYYILNDYNLFANQYKIGMTAIMTEYDFESVCSACDGLFVPGSGTNIDPAYYGMPPLDSPEPVDEYALDSKVIRYFLDHKKPVFGICGGHQALNVFLGGTIKLVDNLQDHYDAGEPNHVIDITEGSFVHEVFSAPSAVVNSYHSWEIGRLAPELEVAARTRDGVIEAVECKERNIFATQWHPEQSFHTGDPLENKFIENFLKRCEACRFGG